MKPGRHRKGSKTRNLQGRTKGLETNFAEDEDNQNIVIVCSDSDDN